MSNNNSGVGSLIGVVMGTQLGCFLVVLVFNLVIGGWSVNAILDWFGKDIPTWGDVLIGLFVAQASVPIAIVGELLQYFGVF